MAKLRKGDRVYTGNFGFATVVSTRIIYEHDGASILVAPDQEKQAIAANRARGEEHRGAVVTVPLSYCFRLTKESEHFVIRAGAFHWKIKELVLYWLQMDSYSIKEIRILFRNVAEISLYERN